ncbi:hypothetical protein [Pyxidicoccus caerfyrddinensis]|uniref:hypothetical protein n=1 Tax=Pyxidicoccus caerfyrddinensis TaxID=2709663 RepID=UPI0013D921E4|nr:hypothetical protein [Pyxidicoccus caerfyrddinensis]
MKTLKQWMVLGAVAAAMMTVAGCRQKSQEQEGAGMEGTGGSGSSGMSSQDTGTTGTGGSGKAKAKVDAGTMMDAGTGGSGSVDTVPEDTQQR